MFAKKTTLEDRIKNLKALYVSITMSYSGHHQVKRASQSLALTIINLEKHHQNPHVLRDARNQIYDLMHYMNAQEKSIMKETLSLLK